MAAPSGKRVLVVGGGIGGLATAIALRRVGFEPVVFERYPELREAGAAVQIWVNGMQALAELGLAEAVLANGARLERLQFRSWRDRRLISAPLGDFHRQFGSVAAVVPRPHLHLTLAAALPAGAIRLAAHCVGFEQDADGVTARFADGSEERGDLLVGADGLRSMVRKQLHGEGGLRFAGYEEYRALIPLEHPAFPRDELRLFWGRGARVGLADAGGGRVWLFIVPRAPERPSGPSTGQKAALVERFRGWPDLVGAAIAATPEEALFRASIYDIAPLPWWGKGRVTLLGDAAHATTPNLGRGAGEALHDAVALATHLGRGSDIPTALQAYEAERREPTADVVRLSRQIGDLGCWEHRLACTLRDGMMGAILRYPMVRQMKREFELAGVSRAGAKRADLR